MGRGERIEHFETVRRRRDGSVVNISLTVSPVKNAKARSSFPPKLLATSRSARCTRATEAFCQRIEASNPNNLATVRAIAPPVDNSDDEERLFARLWKHRSNIFKISLASALQWKAMQKYGLIRPTPCSLVLGFTPQPCIQPERSGRTRTRCENTRRRPSPFRREPVAGPRNLVRGQIALTTPAQDNRNSSTTRPKNKATSIAHRRVWRQSPAADE